MLKNLLDVFRPLRWYRNVSMVLGSLLALRLLGSPISDLFTPNHLQSFIISFIGICLVASGNYGINEILDSETDRHHPKKKERAIPSGRISAQLVAVISVFLYAAGIILVASLGNYMLTLSVVLLLISGILYNVKPFRFKDKPYLDFSFEALNNPIRLMVGWYAITPANQIVPASFVLGFWFLGIFLMASKRFGEIRFIKDPEAAHRYRNSLRYYTQERVLFAMIGALVCFSFMLGALCMKYSVDLILFLPFVAIWVIWFFHLAHQENSIVKDPERVFEQKPFFFYSLATSAVFLYLFYSGNQILGWVK
jgi:decaprenyl-phosphate phosphoribosyltransferase